MADDLSGFSMLELFRLEAEGQTAVLSAGVLAIEDLDKSPATVEAMMRAAHSLKGAARIVGLDPAVRVAHALEDVFVACGKGTLRVRSEHADVLLGAIDFLSGISTDDRATSPGSPWEAKAASVVSALEAIATDQAVTTSPESPPLPVPKSAQQAPVKEAPTNEPPQAEIGTVSAAIAEPTDRAVRVSAEVLSRLVGLAGEALVETRQMRPFIDTLHHLRSLQADLCDAVAAIDDKLEDQNANGGASIASAVASLRERTDAILASIIRHTEDFEAFARRNEDLSSRLHHEVITSRMRPLADRIHGFPRLVRDLSRTLGKQIRFEVVGDQTGVDRDILDKLEAPLSHLVRNAVDHGIETPGVRAATGKPEVGTVLLEARHRAGMLQLRLSDDGRGIDLERLRAKAVARGLVAEAVASQLSDHELLEFLFLPGFSTKDHVTEISGRGVGLDVVQSMVKAVGGGVRVTTETGKRTVFTLQLPITMSVIRALLVRIADEPYAFPLTRIDHILPVAHDRIRTLEGRQYFDHDGTAIGLVQAAEVLGLPGPPPPDPMPVVVVSDRGQQFGMIVDAFLGERDLEVRPLDPRLGKVPDISSASLLENGDPVLIVDVEDLVRNIDNLLSGRRLSRVGSEKLSLENRPRKRILVVDDSITVRELERQLLHSRGYAVDVAVDGMDGWNAVRSTPYDLVVTDVDMPRMDGIGLVSLIKADPVRREIPVVIVSYKDREEDRLRGLDAGANRYLTKSSFHDETFLDTILDLIGEPL